MTVPTAEATRTRRRYRGDTACVAILVLPRGIVYFRADPTTSSFKRFPQGRSNPTPPDAGNLAGYGLRATARRRIHGGFPPNGADGQRRFRGQLRHIGRFAVQISRPK